MLQNTAVLSVAPGFVPASTMPATTGTIPPTIQKETPATFSMPLRPDSILRESEIKQAVTLSRKQDAANEKTEDLVGWSVFSGLIAGAAIVGHSIYQWKNQAEEPVKPVKVSACVH